MKYTTVLIASLLCASLAQATVTRFGAPTTTARDTVVLLDTRFEAAGEKRPGKLMLVR